MKLLDLKKKVNNFFDLNSWRPMIHNDLGNIKTDSNKFFSELKVAVIMEKIVLEKNYRFQIWHENMS